MSQTTKCLFSPATRLAATALYRLGASNRDLDFTLLASQLRDLVRRNDARKALRSAPLKLALRGKITEQLDEVLGMLLDHCHGTVSPAAVSHTIMASEHRADLLSEAQLAAMNGSMLPLLVLRELLHRYDVAFDLPSMASWPRFQRRFGGVMVAMVLCRPR